MAKTTTPLLSFKAHGTIANTISFQKRGKGTMVRKKPVPTDPRSDRQLWHRYLYRQACQYWQTLTIAQKQTWETNARPYHMSGFAYFMKAELDRLTNLVLCYPLDEGSGSTAIDFSGNLNHGTLYGPSWADGKFGKCLSFDGLDDYVDCGSPSIYDFTTALTLEAWVKITTFSSCGIISKRQIGVDNLWQLFEKTPQRSFRFACWVGGVVYIAESSLGYSTDTWYHLIATYDGQYLRIYINGSLDCTPILAPGSIDIGNSHIHLGRYYSSAYTLLGYIDEVRINNAVLTATEREMHYKRSG